MIDKLMLQTPNNNIKQSNIPFINSGTNNRVDFDINIALRIDKNQD